jgi:hypothetical protein
MTPAQWVKHYREQQAAAKRAAAEQEPIQASITAERLCIAEEDQ